MEYQPTRTLCFFFFNDTATTEIYTLSLHDALPISPRKAGRTWWTAFSIPTARRISLRSRKRRSEEHTSELQSQSNLVCRLLLEKKKNRENRSRPRGEPGVCRGLRADRDIRCRVALY